ncbi:MAG: hypothetical protein ABR523_11680, partial [Desulfurivibrionaceae bacterium]
KMVWESLWGGNNRMTSWGGEKRIMGSGLEISVFLFLWPNHGLQPFCQMCSDVVFYYFDKLRK